jgi:hypothetical protein
MNVSEILANEFLVRYDETDERLLVFALKNGKPDSHVPISLRLAMLKGMGPDEASKWVGQTLLLLIPSMRETVFNLPKEPR